MNTKDMTPDQLRIACAEKCGWTVVEDISKFATHHIQKPDKTFCWSWICRYPQNIESVKLLHYPDYEHDRNTLHELLLAVPEAKHSKFVIALEKIVFDRDIPAIISVYVYDFLVADPLAIMRAFLEVMRIDDIKTD